MKFGRLAIDPAGISHFTNKPYKFMSFDPSSEERLHAVLATLEKCQAALVLGGDRDAAQLVSVAILELRIKLNRIEDSELKALCDGVLRDVEAIDRPPHPKPHEGPRGRSPVSLKLVK